MRVVLALLVALRPASGGQALQVHQGCVQQLDVLLDDVGQLTDLRVRAECMHCLVLGMEWVDKVGILGAHRLVKVGTLPTLSTMT